MPLRLRKDAVAGVDQDDGEVGGRGPGCHVSRVLLVSRRVGDDELPPVGREIAVGDVDRDALLPLVLQAVGEQREIDILAGGAIPRGVLADGGKLILVDHLRLVEEPADERALAVVDAAAGDEPQHRLVLVAAQVLADVLGDEVVHGMGHQKYPSCFFFSIDPLESWSMTRPWRSELAVRSISWMISSSVDAVLSTAPVSG